jgi:hypothetical protein
VCKHPEITVKLVGGDGNAFAILGSVVRAMRAAKLTDQEIAQFRDEAMSGDYDHAANVHEVGGGRIAIDPPRRGDAGTSGSRRLFFV